MTWGWGRLAHNDILYMGGGGAWIIQEGLAYHVVISTALIDISK